MTNCSLLLLLLLSLLAAARAQSHMDPKKHSEELFKMLDKVEVAARCTLRWKPTVLTSQLPAHACGGGRTRTAS